MLPITTPEELIGCFKNCKDSDRAKILKRIKIPVSEFERFATWERECYTRNCLVRNEKFEFILLCWETGVKTPVHGHGGQNCWVYSISGELVEKRYETKEEGFGLLKTMTLNEGSLTYMNDEMGYHSLENTHNGRSMTLHIYAKPIQRCEVYNENTGSFQMKEMEYDSVAKMV